MTEDKKNCWEVMGCGREPGGAKASEMGVCPVCKDTRLDGVHEGKNAGRACWAVAGSMCGGKVQGTYALKYKDCSECAFYQRVKKEESWKFETLGRLLMRLRDEPKDDPPDKD